MDLIADVVIPLIKIFVILNVVLISVAMLVWAERRVSAFIQDRLGPNRVGPLGLLQSIADVMKFVFKEDVVPGHVNRPFFILAPALAVMPPLVTVAVVPWASNLMIADLDTGILFVFAISSLGVYGMTIGGWASNSKYSLIGGVRASAQMVSYEICIGLSVVGIFLLAGTLRLNDIVMMQADGIWLFGNHYDGFIGRLLDWNIVKQPLAFLIFFISAFAETNRLPFDFPEAEQELAAGFHTEYSSMKFALFFLGEYAAMFVISAITVTLFLGGWSFFGLESIGWPVQVLIFGGKLVALLFFFIWVRWTLPRFRYDQLMKIGWQILLPLALLNIVATAILKVIFEV